MRFFTSDTHFGHANIIRYCNRPFADVPEMNEALIANWNAVVGEDDIVYHLGDVALGPWEEWDGIMTRLNGRKRLVVGNHERIFAAEPAKRRERFQPLYEGWFEHITSNWEDFALSNGRWVNLSHFPYEADHMEKSRHMEHRLPDNGTTLIHGHTHDGGVPVSYSAKGTLQIHVGQDAWDYTPVSEDQLIALLDGIA